MAAAIAVTSRIKLVYFNHVNDTLVQIGIRCTSFLKKFRRFLSAPIKYTCEAMFGKVAREKSISIVETLKRCSFRLYFLFSRIYFDSQVHDFFVAALL